MRKLLIVAFALVSATAIVSACGRHEDTRNNVSKAPAPTVPPSASDLAQKASVADVTPLPAGDVTGTDARPVRYSLVLGEGRGGFAFNAKVLSDEAKAKIDEMFTDGKVDLKGAHFEIEGHTDNLGSKAVNERIGLERAEAVRQYICQKYEVPMESISVISFGMEKPIADNATDEGRAVNRRVIIRVVD